MLLRRIGGLAALFIGELLAITTLLDTGTLQSTGGLGSVVADYGPRVLRLITGSALCLLVFGGSRTSKELRRRASAELMNHRINWLHPLAHLALVIVFAGVGSILFSASLPAPLDSGLMALWLLAGALAALTAALTLVPPIAWRPLLRLLQPVSTFAMAAALGAYAFGVLVQHQWRLLSRSTMFVAHAILASFISGIQTDPAALVIIAPNFQVGVSAECSGSEGLGLILAFAAAWLWFHREEWRFPHALLLVPVGLLAIWMINCLRIAALVFIGNAGAHRIAMGGFHSEAGWLGFNIVALAICLAARQMPWLKRTPTEPASTSDQVNPTAAYVTPFLAILGSAMISRLGSDEFDWFYGLRVIACAATLWYFAPTYRLFEWRVSWISPVLGCVVFAIWIGLDRVAGSVSPATMPWALREAPGVWTAAWVAFRLAGAVLAVPIAEELAFRGFLLRRFVAADFESVSWGSISWVAMLLSSIAFGVLHPERWAAAAVAGMVYAFAVRRRGSIGDAIAAHATTNGLVAGWILLGGDWRLW